MTDRVKVQLTPEEEKILAELHEQQKQLAEKNNRITIEDCNNMSWKDFEVHVGKLYEKMGYEVEKTSGGGDHGCDLVLSKNGRKTVVDAKHWKSDMHSKVVGQVLRAISYYDANDGIIIGISHFTKWAIEEAEKTQIELVDRDRLEKLLYEYPITRVKNSQSISDITIDEIYEENLDYVEIVRDMIKFVLRDREKGRFQWTPADEMEGIIHRKIAARLVPMDKLEETYEKILELLKSEYKLDLVVEKDTPDEGGKVDIGVLQGRPRSEASKLSTFMETIRLLEGDNKSPVPEQELIDELEKSEKFKDEDEVRRFIRKMINEAAIYYSAPDCCNSI